MVSSLATLARPAPAVVLHGEETASGLADMLRQFLEQSLGDSERKARAAARLHGRMFFRSAEDPGICVSMEFAGDRIELRDVGSGRAAGPSITGDFLSIAHLTTGQEGPLGLVMRRKLRVRFLPSHVPFLVRVLLLMRVESEYDARERRRRMAVAVAATCVAAVIVWWVAVHR